MWATGNTYTMNKTDAAAFLGIGQRTLERHTSVGRITANRIKTPNGPALDYSTEELDRFRREVLEAPQPQVLAPSPPSPPPSTALATPASSNALALSRVEPQVLAHVAETEGAGLVEVLAKLAEVAATVAARDGKPTVPLADKLTLSLDEATALSGVPRSTLRAAIGGGTLKGHRIGRGWRVKRADLESYIERL